MAEPACDGSWGRFGIERGVAIDRIAQGGVHGEFGARLGAGGAEAPDPGAMRPHRASDSQRGHRGQSTTLASNLGASWNPNSAH